MEMQPKTAQQLREALQLGPTQFGFKKLGGTLRFASGTTNLALIPMEHHPKGTGREGRKVNFFDLQKQAWRSVSERSELYIL